ncbi:MAG: hypothetical protein HYZ54_01970 [Ignavibacteriae bacterium]|nr:hypothetical protein [Ignavibacteriota bacterium]
MITNNEQNNNPTFTNEVLLPQHFNFSLQDIRKMKEPEYKNYIEEVRLSLLELINKKCPPFGVRLSEKEIIENMKVLNTENGITVILPDRKSRYIFSCDIKNENLSLQYKSHHTQGINHWFFQIWETETWQGKSPLALFHNADTFFKNMNAIIRKGKFKLLERKPNATITDCIDLLKITNGSKPAYNFPCSVAKWIYLNSAERLTSELEDFYIFDPCMGFGGRLGGALASCNHSPLNNRTVHYYGTDVNTSIHQQYKKVENYWKQHISQPLKFSMYNSLVPAENIFEDSVFTLMEGKFHVALTSCPYFNCEQYSKDPDQSYIKYPLYDQGGENSWKLGFLKRMIENTYRLLRDNGEFWLNIADINSNKNLFKNPIISLESDAKRFAIEAGFTHVITYNMVMPDINAQPQNQVEEVINHKITRDNKIVRQGKKMKFEPIFVFKKLRRNT